MSAACPRLGFTVLLSYDPAARAAVHAAAAAALDALGLDAEWGEAAAPAGAPERWRLLLTRVGSQTAEPDRDAVRAWADGRPDVVAWEVGPLIDLGA